MDYNSKADALDRMAVQQMALIEVAEDFRTLGSMDGAVKQLRQENADALTTLTNTNKALLRAEQDVLDAESKAAQVAKDADAKAHDLLADAANERMKLIQDANDHADMVEAQGQANALAYGESVKSEWAITKEHLESARTEIGAARIERDDINKQVADAQAKLAAVNETLRKMLGQ